MRVHLLGGLLPLFVSVFVWEGGSVIWILASGTFVISSQLAARDWRAVVGLRAWVGRATRLRLRMLLPIAGLTLRLCALGLSCLVSLLDQCLLQQYLLLGQLSLQLFLFGFLFAPTLSKGRTDHRGKCRVWTAALCAS